METSASTAAIPPEIYAASFCFRPFIVKETSAAMENRVGIQPAYGEEGENSM